MTRMSHCYRCCCHCSCPCCLSLSELLSSHPHLGPLPHPHCCSNNNDNNMTFLSHCYCCHCCPCCYSRGTSYLFLAVYLSRLYTFLSLLLQQLYHYHIPGLSQRSGHPNLGSLDLSLFGRQYHFPMLLFIA